MDVPTPGTVLCQEVYYYYINKHVYDTKSLSCVPHKHTHIIYTYVMEKVEFANVRKMLKAGLKIDYRSVSNS